MGVRLHKKRKMELIGHPKNQGNNMQNSKTNSLNPGENDAGCMAIKGIKGLKG